MALNRPGAGDGNPPHRAEITRNLINAVEPFDFPEV
jgi:hypothetical protein